MNFQHLILILLLNIYGFVCIDASSSETSLDMIFAKLTARLDQLEEQMDKIKTDFFLPKPLKPEFMTYGSFSFPKHPVITYSPDELSRSRNQSNLYGPGHLKQYSIFERESAIFYAPVSGTYYLTLTMTRTYSGDDVQFKSYYVFLTKGRSVEGKIAFYRLGKGETRSISVLANLHAKEDIWVNALCKDRATEKECTEKENEYIKPSLLGFLLNEQ